MKLNLNHTLYAHPGALPLAQVSPHEFMQAVMAASGKRFVIDRQADPVDFLSWFLNALHADLTGGKRKKPSVVTRCFQVRRDWGFCHMRASGGGKNLRMRGQRQLR